MRPGEMSPDQRPTFALGVVVAVITTPLWFFIVAWGTSLTNSSFLLVLIVLSSATTVLGCLLTIPWHSRRFGVGLVVGAPIAWFIEMVILAMLLANALS